MILMVLVSCGPTPLSKVVHYTNKIPPKPISLTKIAPHATITGKSGGFTKNNGVSNKTLTFHIRYPQNHGFSTKSLRCQDILKLEVSVRGIAMAPIYADGSDGSNQIAASDGCDVTATISSVPFGAARIAQVRAFSAGPTLIPGSEIRAVFDINSTPTNVELSYKSTPAANIVNQIITTPNPFIASHMDLGDLNTLVDGITVPAGSFPNYTYTVHPTLINTANIVSDLLGNGGDSSALSSGTPAYKNAASTVNGTIAGLLPTDNATVRVSDPGSPAQTNLANGAFSFSGNVTPGNWVVYATGIGGTTYNVSGTPSANVSTPGSTVNIGTITLTPLAPTLGSLSATSGAPGQTITLNGSNFHLNSDNTIVNFGSVQLTGTAIQVIDSTQINVQVPNTLQGTVSVSVTVGGGTSGGINFNILPGILEVIPNSGFTNQTNEIVVYGGGFVSGATVDSGGTACTNVVYVNSTTITCQIPNGAALGFYNVKVTNPNTDNFTLSNGYESKPPIYLWSHMGFAPPNNGSLAIDPKFSNIVYAGNNGGDGVYKTFASGGGWVKVNDGLTGDNVVDLAVSDVVNTLIYAALDNNAGVYRSENGGINWQYSGLAGQTINRIKVHPVNPIHILAGTPLGVQRSTDGGKSWELLNSGLGNTVVNDIAFNPGTPTTVFVATDGGVYKSTNSGDTWALSNTLLTVTPVTNILFNPTLTSTMFAGTVNRPFTSSLSGSIWSTANTGITSGSTDRELLIDPATTTRLYSATNNGVWRTTNAGTTWLAKNTGLSSTDMQDIIIDPNTPANLYATTVNGNIFKSTDNADNWGPTATQLGNLAIRDIEISPANPAILGAATAGGMYRSGDFGANWQAINTGLGDLDVTSFEQNPNTGSNAIAGTTSGIYLTTNIGGATPTWTASNTGLSNTNIRDVMYDPGNSGHIYCGTANGMFKSTNNGANWSAINSGLPGGAARNIRVISVDPIVNSTVVLATADGVYVSTNSGGTWAPKNTGISGSRDMTSLVVNPSNPLTVYAGRNPDGKIFKTTNVNTNNWTEFHQGLPLPMGDAFSLAIDPTNDNVILAGFVSNDGFYVRSCIGPCPPWRKEVEGLPAGSAQDIRHIATDTTNKFVYIGTGNGIYRVKR